MKRELKRYDGTVWGVIENGILRIEGQVAKDDDDETFLGMELLYFYELRPKTVVVETPDGHSYSVSYTTWQKRGKVGQVNSKDMMLLHTKHFAKYPTIGI